MTNDNIVDLKKNLDRTIFKPTERQQEAKARFHSKLSTIWTNKDNIPLDKMCEMAGTTTVKKWAAQDPNFMAWFLEEQTVQHKLAAAAELAVEALHNILSEQDVGPKGKVTGAQQARAAELILNYTGHKPVTKTETIEKSKEELSQMSKKELLAFLTSYQKSLEDDDDQTDS